MADEPEPRVVRVPEYVGWVLLAVLAAAAVLARL